MQSFMVSLVGLVLSVSVGAEPLLKGRVWLASGPPAAGVQVRLFDLTDLRRSVGTTTDEAGYFALRLQALSTAGHPALPQDFALGQNYPNPFNPSTIIPYQIPTTTHVRLEVFNLLGQRLATLVDGDRPAGAHTAQWDATDAAGRAVGSGVFIYRLTGGGHTVSRRMVLIDGQAGIPAGAAGPGPSQTAAVGVKTEGSVYGLTAAGAGLIAYVDPAFRVGTDPVNLVLEQPGGKARMKVTTSGILGDVNNDGQVDAFDVLYVALYSQDPSITLPNNGDISLGDVNRDGTVDLADGLLLALYKVNPSDPTLPPGIGQPVDGSGDDHGDTPSAATALAVGSSRLGQLETGGDVDYFRVAVSESGDLTVHTTGNLDTKGQLEDSAGGVLARDDDGGDGYNFRIAHAVSAGTYYLKVEGYDATTTGSYTIHASGPGGGDGGPVNIPDANLRAVIAEALGRAPNAPITEDEMATLTELRAGDQGIRNLAGLEFATNLTLLWLGDNSITDVSPLSGLTNLTELSLRFNSISDVSPLSGLTNLTGLSLRFNSISDVSPLSGLTNLTLLWLNGNSISDVSPLSGLTNLTELRLSENDISDISPLVANTGLGSGDEVYLVNNPLSSTSLNTHIPALESRGVTVHLEYEGDGDDHGDTPSSATPLAVGGSRSGQLETGGDVDYFRVEVTASGELTVHTTGNLDTKGQLEDSAGGVLARDDDGGDGYNFRIAHAVRAGTYYIKVEGYDASTTGSYTIHASGPSGGDGGPVNIPDANLRAVIAEALGKASGATITEAEMAALTELEARDQGIRDLTGLEFATNLTRLQLGLNNLSDVSPLSGLTNLTQLTLHGSNLSDVSPLSGLTNLTRLQLGLNNLSDVSPLSGLTNLTWLHLEFNNLSDVSPLSGLTNLTWLTLESNNLSDVSPLSGLTRLEALDLRANSIADVSPLSGLTNLTSLHLESNNLSDVSPLSGLTNLTWLYLNDNSISDISPLVANTGLGSGDEVYLVNNPLSSTSLNTHIPALESRGVTVHYDDDGGGGDDHGDTPSSASALAVGSSRSGQLETGGDVDYFRVEVSASGELTVHTTGSLDTKGQLEDSAGGVLARDDDGGDGYNFRLAHAVSAGTYYLKVEGYDATTTGSYTIHASGPGGGDDDGTVNIADANLRAVIAEALGKAPNAPITPDEMATLTELRAGDQGIRNLAGLEFATNLQTLDLGREWVDGRWVNSNDISDLSPLSGLTNLTTLWLDDNNLSDVSPLSGLTNLTTLGLYFNDITDVSPLSGLTNLTTLGLSDNSISDVSPLSGLTNLTTLGLYFNDITDVSPLSGLTNLTWLGLFDNNISDVSPLSGLTNLTELRLSDNNISDISPLSGLTNLTHLGLGANSISDVSPLSGLTNLTELGLENNNISDISPLVANTGLGSGDEVYLYDNPLSSTSLNTHIPALESRGVTVHYGGSAKVIAGDAKSSMQGRMNAPRSERLNRKSAR